MEYKCLEVFFKPEKDKFQDVKPKKEAQVQVVIDEQTGTVEWRTSELTHTEVEKIRQILGRKKAKTKHWNELRNLLSTNSIQQVAEKNRGKKGFSVSEIKVFSSTLSKIKK